MNNTPLRRCLTFVGTLLVVLASLPYDMRHLWPVSSIAAVPGSAAPLLDSQLYLPVMLQRHPQELAYLAPVQLGEGGVGSDVFVMSGDGFNQRRLTFNARATNAPNCTTFAWSPDGNTLAFLDGYDIFVVHADGTGLVEVTTTNSVFCFSWAPDSAKLVFMMQEGLTITNIFRVDADGSDLSRVTYTAGIKGAPSWSPNGMHILFPYEDGKIYRINADGSSPIALADGGHPIWSPDGSKFAFERSQSLYVAEANGTQPRMVWTGGMAEWISWSPDSTRLAFKNFNDAELYTVTVDGTQLVNLSNHPAANDSTPTWSPDGQQLAFTSDRAAIGQTFHVYRVNNDGSGLTRLPTTTVASSPAWRP